MFDKEVRTIHCESTNRLHFDKGEKQKVYNAAKKLIKTLPTCKIANVEHEVLANSITVVLEFRDNFGKGQFATHDVQKLRELITNQSLFSY